MKIKEILKEQWKQILESLVLGLSGSLIMNSRFIELFSKEVPEVVTTLKTKNKNIEV